MSIFRKRTSAQPSEAEAFAQKHLFRTAEGTHTAQDMKLFDAFNALARSHGLPRQDEKGSCHLRPIVKDFTTLRLDINGYSPSVNTQAQTLISLLQEAGLKDIKDQPWTIPKEGGVFHAPSDRDYYGHYIDVDMQANGGVERVIKKIERVTEHKHSSHAERLESARSLPSSGGMMRG